MTNNNDINELLIDEDSEPDMVEAKVTRIPLCDFCAEHRISTPAEYDASTTSGPWAFMCGSHYNQHHRGGLGTGKGQRLVKI